MAAGYGDAWRQGMAAGYPSPELTLKFIKWLLTTRKQQSHVTRREGRELIGRSTKQVTLQLAWMRNHVWPTLFAAAGFPSGPAAVQYWRPVRKHVESLVEGGGGGVRQLASVAQAGAEAAQRAAGADLGKIKVGWRARFGKNTGVEHFSLLLLSRSMRV